MKFQTRTTNSVWDYQHAAVIREWLDDQSIAKQHAIVWASTSAGLCLFFAIAVVLFIGWLRSTKDRRILARQTSRECVTGQTPITIAKVPLPTENESSGTLAVGIQGMGKSLLVSSIVSQARARGDSGIAVDYRGELAAQYARPGDVILNHFDRRGVHWFPPIEARNDIEREHLLNLFLPVTGVNPTHDHFQTAGQIILEPVFRHAHTNLDIWRALAERDRLEALVKRTVAERYISTDTRSGGDNMTTLINALRALRYLPARIGTDDQTFSIRRFVRHTRPHPGPWIWIIVPEEARRALRPLLPLWVGLAISEVLALHETQTARFWVITDELGQLPALAEFDSALTNGRKPGLAVVSGAQTLDQIYSIYGEHQARTILSCFQTKLILTQGSPDTADYFSQCLGEREVHEMLRSTGRNGTVYTEHIRLKRNVLCSELLHLPKRTGYLSISPYPHAKVRLPIPRKRPKVLVPFEPRQPGSEPTAGELYDAEMATAHKNNASPTIAVPQGPSVSTTPLVIPPRDALDLSAFNSSSARK
ncbi:MAG: type IV secretion system DNA-binding domain-containing protein [Gammaproteobacteria bacterium]